MIFNRRITRPGGRHFALLALVVAALTSTDARAAEAAKGRVAEVVLYRGQAKVVRIVDVGAGQGPVEMVVTDLPEHVVGSSLYAESTAGVDVRAVRYRQRAVGEAPREEVRALDQKIEAQQDQIKLNQQLQQLVASQLKYLDRMEGFIAPTANADLRRGVLKTEALEKISLFSFKKREELANRSVDLKKKARELKTQAQLLAQQRSQIAGGASRSVHEAILFLEKRVAGPQKLRLTYLVGNCAWTPAYNFRADSKRRRVAIEYNALIQQMSGEDWADVKLTLSTASPTLSAAGPALGAFQVNLVPLAQQTKGSAQQAGQTVQQQLKKLQARQRVAEQQTAQSFTQQGNFDASWSLNRGASDFQLLELANPKHEMTTYQSDSAGADNGPSLSYEIAAAVDLASRRDQQMVRILGDELGTNFYHVATPVLTPQVYREAELTNT
ncbi:MAG: mucoidy inhibitor MuiA family protein, partial [Phycisphaerae bacterium]|nr:mucoidy inhibitor MuiA family protein [Phycisphaerae bacterium]